MGIFDFLFGKKKTTSEPKAIVKKLNKEVNYTNNDADDQKILKAQKHNELIKEFDKLIEQAKNLTETQKVKVLGVLEKAKADAVAKFSQEEAEVQIKREDMSQKEKAGAPPPPSDGEKEDSKPKKTVKKTTKAVKSKEILASTFFYLFVIYMGFDREDDDNEKRTPEGSFIINDKLLMEIEQNASKEQLKQFEHSLGFGINEISRQIFYSKLLSTSKVDNIKTLMAMDYDKKRTLFKNSSYMMKEDDNGMVCSKLQVGAVGSFSYNLLGKDHATTNALVKLGKYLYGLD